MACHPVVREGTSTSVTCDLDEQGHRQLWKHEGHAQDLCFVPHAGAAAVLISLAVYRLTFVPAVQAAFAPLCCARPDITSFDLSKHA